MSAFEYKELYLSSICRLTTRFSASTSCGRHSKLLNTFDISKNASLIFDGETVMSRQIKSAYVAPFSVAPILSVSKYSCLLRYVAKATKEHVLCHVCNSTDFFPVAFAHIFQCSHCAGVHFLYALL